MKYLEQCWAHGKHSVFACVVLVHFQWYTSFLLSGAFTENIPDQELQPHFQSLEKMYKLHLESSASGSGEHGCFRLIPCWE